ncbi:MAG: hypothetical protein FWD31_00715 [Planctomycetaceae bacterium]|nr:hypothetical protein [Planctomycetaceae bacterium]
MSKTILVIDPNRKRLSEIVPFWHKSPWQTLTAASLEEAIDILDDAAVDMIITVEDLGWLSGTEFLALTHHRYPRMIRVLITHELLKENEKPLSAYFHAEDHFHVTTSQPYTSDFMTEIVREMFGMEERMTHRVSGQQSRK